MVETHRVEKNLKGGNMKSCNIFCPQPLLMNYLSRLL